MPLRVVFVAPEEPSVMPRFFEKVIPALRDDVAAIAVVRPIYKDSTWRAQARRFIAAFGVARFTLEAVVFAFHKGLDLLRSIVPLGRVRSVKRLAMLQRVPLYQPEDVNSPEFLAALRLLSPDLIVSVSCPQIFRKALLELPALGCINVHSSLLPKYRGMLPTFWALLNGEEETGVTVHFMSDGLDEGDIVVQRSVPITSDDTLHSLMRKCKEVASDLVVEAVRQFQVGRVSRSPNRIDLGAYFSFPTREDVDRFRAAGRRV